MRVIRTEMYFDREFLPIPSGPPNPGIAFAWFNTGDLGTLSLMDIQSFDSDLDRYMIRNLRPIAIDDESQLNLRAFILAALTDEPIFQPNVTGLASPLISAVLENNIVIERSPPLSFNLKDLPKNVSSAAVGTFMGIESVGDAHMLMFLTIPSGIIIVGAAIGISKGLEAGLNKAVSRLFNRGSGTPAGRTPPARR